MTVSPLGAQHGTALALLSAILLAVSPAHYSAGQEAEERTWTSSDGKTLTGTLIELEGEQISIRIGGKVFQLPLSRLSEDDQGYAKQWKASQAREMVEDSSHLGDFTDLELGVWPNHVAAEFDVDDIQVVKEAEEENLYVYRSPHFEFQSPLKLSKSVVREFARIFEATFEFARTVPIGLNPQPSTGGFFLTKLYQSRDDYYADGGMEGSSGMHSYRYQGDDIISSIIKVPLSNLGVEYTGTRYVVDHKKRSSTLVHEVVHQVTGRWLPVLPTWFKEGFAEFISVQPYENGRFRLTQLDRSIRDDIEKLTGNGREFTMVDVESLMEITPSQWAAELAAGAGSINYRSANLLFYYFLRLDGEGDGNGLVEYMKAIASGSEEEEARYEFLLAGRNFEELQNAVADAWRGEGMRLEFR